MELLQNRPTSDIDELLAVICRRSAGKRVHHIELFLDNEIKKQVAERFGLGRAIDPNDPLADLLRDIELHAFLGYDAFRFGLRTGDIFPLPRASVADTTDIAAQSRGERSWSDEHVGPIRSWQDFESYPWPKIAAIDFSSLEWLEKHLPPNMGCYELTAHILEIVTWLLGYETLCYKIYDDPALVDAISDKVGAFYLDFTRVLCDCACMRLIWGSDDMGFRTGTLVSADFLRKNIFPWHKRCAELAHEHNRPYLLHACGNLEEVMDDLIDDVGIDAKHSFEDTIVPVTQSKKKYGNRLTLLGGIDVDFLCTADEKAIRQRVRKTLETCLPGGGYCLGTGNSVANYIPLDSYLTMLDEGNKFSLR